MSPQMLRLLSIIDSALAAVLGSAAVGSAEAPVIDVTAVVAAVGLCYCCLK